MRIRVVISGIIAGAISQFILKFMIFNIRLGEIVPGWLTVKPAVELPAWLGLALIGMACFVIFIFGWIAARWNWSRTWNASFLSGAGSGLIAGALAFCFIGAFHAGIEGQIGILTGIQHPVSETEAVAILLDSLGLTALRNYGHLGIYLFGGALSGALGGLVSMVDRNDVWGRPVSACDPWLFRLSAYGLTLSGLANLIVTIAVVNVFDDVGNQAMLENNLGEEVTYWPGIVSILAIYTGVLLMYAPVAMTWGWTLRNWIVEQRRNFIAGLWFVVTLGYVLYWTVSYALEISDIAFFMLRVIGFIFLILGIFTAIGWSVKPAPESEWTHYTFGDHLAYALTGGILGGVQVAGGVMTYAISVTQISISNMSVLFNLDEPVTSTLVEQINLLYSLQIQLSLVAMGISMTLGLLFSLVLGFIRWAFKKEKKTQSPLNEFA